MDENPYGPPSPESSTVESEYLTASEIKPCPICGQNVGRGQFLRMAFCFPPTHVKCPSCGASLYCGGQLPGYSLIGMQFLGVSTIVVRGIQLWITTTWLAALGFAATMAVVSIVGLMVLALFVRRYTELTVGR